MLVGHCSNITFSLVDSFEHLTPIQMSLIDTPGSEPRGAHAATPELYKPERKQLDGPPINILKVVLETKSAMPQVDKATDAHEALQRVKMGRSLVDSGAFVVLSGKMARSSPI